MKMFQQHLRRAGLAVVALSAIGMSPAAFAAGTDYGTNITNTASVNYSVSGVPQTVIRSSPLGNSTPGTAGTATDFEVDKRVNFVTEETNTAATVTSPGLNTVVTVFRVSSTTNGTQEFGLVANNATTPPVIFGRTDAFDMTAGTFTIHVSAAACTTATMATPAYAGEAATTFVSIPEDECRYVFVRANTPASAANGQAATVILTATASTTGSSGVTPESQTAAADNAAAVDVVFAEAGTLDGNVVRNGVSFAYDQYFVGTLTVTKTAAVISDGFSAAGQAKAIPGAVIEYTISVQNNGLATTAATLTEVIPTNTTYVTGSTTLNGGAVSDVAGAMPFLSNGAINSPGQASGVIVPGTTAAQIAVIRFRVTIN